LNSGWAIRMDEADYLGTVELSVAIEGPPNNAAASKLFGRFSEIYRDFIAMAGGKENLMDYLAAMNEIYRRLSAYYGSIPEGETETQEMRGVLVEKQMAEEFLLGMELTSEEQEIIDKLKNALSGEYQKMLIEDSPESLEISLSGNTRN
jgi:hypothetical protein